MFKAIAKASEVEYKKYAFSFMGKEAIGDLRKKLLLPGNLDKSKLE